MRRVFPLIILLFQLSCLSLFSMDYVVGLPAHTFLRTPVFILIILISSIVLVIEMWINNRRETRQKVTDIESVMQEEFHSLISSVRSDRHDMNNHLTVISGLIQLNHNSRADDYIRKLIGEILINNQMLNIQDPILASLVFASQKKCGLANIEIETSILTNTLSEKLAMTDLVRLMSNILDNAFDETVKYLGENRKITLLIEDTTSGIHIKSSNPTNAHEMNKKWLTLGGSSHSNQTGRGFGLNIIRDVVRRYDGQLVMAVTNNTFTIEILFPVRLT